ncbi:MAG: hypothetical protein QOH37_1815, partial [Nocardioidaceae bacterium]|nr:hypothetical protein [Nocardioidaceae bacterium]
MTATDYSPSGKTGTLLDSRFLEPEIETAPRAEIEAQQESRILDLVAYAWANS